MLSFKSYLQEVTFDAKIDGSPLQPKSIHGAEIQIRTLASNIRTTFGLDERYRDFIRQIQNATALMDKAADMIGNDMGGDVRTQTHRFN